MSCHLFRFKKRNKNIFGKVMTERYEITIMWMRMNNERNKVQLDWKSCILDDVGQKLNVLDTNLSWWVDWYHTMCFCNHNNLII